MRKGIDWSHGLLGAIVVAIPISVLAFAMAVGWVLSRWGWFR